MWKRKDKQPSHESRLSSHDESYLAGAILARDLAMGWRPPPQTAAIALAPGEHVYAQASTRILQHSEQEVTYNRGGLFVFGNPALIVASIAGSIAYNYHQKNKAAAQAAAQWRFLDHGHIFLTSERIAIMGSLAWLDFYYSNLRYSAPDADGVIVMASGQAPLKFLVWPAHWFCVLLRFLAHGEILCPEIPPHLRPYFFPDSAAIGQAPLTPE